MPIPVWRLRDHDRTPRYANQPPGGPGILRGLSGAREQLPAAGAAAAEDRNPPLPDYAARLARDLRRTVAGEVRFGAEARGLYAFDASIFRQVPLGVVLPRDGDDAEAALEVCRRYGAPVLGRGC